MKTTLKNFEDFVIRLNEEGLSYNEIAERVLKEKGYKVAGKRVGRFLQRRGLNKEALNTFEKKLEENNFSVPSNFEYGWLKTKEASIFVRNKEGVIPFEEMRSEFITEMSKHSPNIPEYTRQPIKEKHLLVIDIADLHIGKLADATETGSKYNSKIAKRRALEGVKGVLQKASGFPLDKILFVIGNDVLHVDNANKTTTSGTGQDVDGMWYKNYTIVRDVYVEIINLLLTVADVHIVHNPSNHDYISGFMLADSVYCWFRNSKNVTFDVTNAHRKYYKYGKNLISTSHGDGAKMVDMPLLMANEAPKDWADTYWRYVYLHHIHHKDVTKFKSGKDYQGVCVEYLRSPSGTDSWHAKKGYCHAPKAVEAFVHSKDNGQCARITHLFK